MAKLVCDKCGYQESVPTVCCGTGVKGTDPGKLYCPAGKSHGSQDIPKHCGQNMKVKE